MGGKEAKQRIPDDRKVILVGPDCSGKSTIAKFLAEKYGILPVGNRRINNDLDAAIHVLTFVANEVVRNDAPFVLDQFMYPVDIVYNATLRQSHSAMEDIQNLILPKLVEHNVLFLHVDAGDEAIEARYNERGDELWDLQQILKVSSAYRRYFDYMRNHTPIHYRRIDTSKCSVEAMCSGAYQLVEDFYRGN